MASFPGKMTSATRDIAVGHKQLPLSLSVVSVGKVTFAVGAFALDTDDDAKAAQGVFERKLLDDVGATEPQRGRVVLHAGDRSALDADTFEALGRHGSDAQRAVARFVPRKGRLVEIVVVGPDDTLSTPAGRQAIETFMTSLRLD